MPVLGNWTFGAGVNYLSYWRDSVFGWHSWLTNSEIAALVRLKRLAIPGHSVLVSSNRLKSLVGIGSEQRHPTRYEKPRRGGVHSWYSGRLPAVAAAVAAATAATSRRLRLGFIDLDFSAIQRGAIQLLDRFLSLTVAGHFNEAKALALASIAIGDHRGGIHISTFTECLAKRFFRC